MTTDTVGGAWTFTAELARCLAERGFEIWLAALGGQPTGSQRQEIGRIPGLHLFSSDYKLEWMEDAWQDVAESGTWLLELARRCHPEVVHLNTFGHATLSWRVPVVLTAHSCVASWWKAVKRTDLPSFWDRYRRLVVRSLDAAQIVATPSQAMATALTDRYGLSLRKSRVIHNGRSAAAFRAQGKEEIIFAAGRLWDEGKNIAQLARIAPRLPWPVYLAGPTQGPDGGSRQLQGCRCLGMLSQAELARWYARASIYVLPARYEPFGYSALEAALSGCALVLGDIGSLREIWRDAALYVPPDDVAALDDAVQNLISDKTKRSRMAGKALARARTFSASRMAAGYLRAYGEATAWRRACAS
jgi:glycosyltransferase involved in cell wall biosynthesis